MRVSNWIALGPAAFLIHDAEEIATVEAWLREHHPQLPAVVQPLADVSTRAFATGVAVLLVGFLAAAVHGVVAARRGALSLPFLLVAAAFVANGFTHIAQTAYFAAYTPGVVTAVLVSLPYGYALGRSLRNAGLAAERQLVTALGLGFVLQVPLALLALLAAGHFR